MTTMCHCALLVRLVPLALEQYEGLTLIKIRSANPNPVAGVA
jgi:hypothetical protein